MFDFPPTAFSCENWIDVHKYSVVRYFVLLIQFPNIGAGESYDLAVLARVTHLQFDGYCVTFLPDASDVMLDARDAAEELLHSTAAELLARRSFATARDNYTGMTLETRTLLRRDFTYAMRILRDAMDLLIKISGSSGLMDNNSAQRCWRDVHAISSHVVMNWDVPAENFGRTEFGLPLNPAYPIF